MWRSCRPDARSGYYAPMPTDAALSTYTPTTTFELKQLQPFGDGRLRAALLAREANA